MFFQCCYSYPGCCKASRFCRTRTGGITTGSLSGTGVSTFSGFSPTEGACHRQLHPVNQKIALSTSSTYKCSLTPGFLQPPSFLRQQMLLIWCCWSLQAIFYPGIMEVKPHDFHTLKITWPLFLNSQTMHTYEGLWNPMDLSESTKTCRKPSLTSLWRTRYHGISRCHDAPWSQTCTSVGGAGIPAGQRSKVAAGAWDAVSQKVLEA